MTNSPRSTPRWIVARLGEDLNWWIDQTSDELGTEPGRLGLLDPTQVAHLMQALDGYRPYGLDPEQVSQAFQTYSIESELDDQRVRVSRCDESIYNTSEKLFAFPLDEEEGTGPYAKLLVSLSAARIRMLNRTHDYAHACTEDEMYEELDATDSDRFFSDESLHPFEEISEILQWKPAEWDDPES